MSSSINKIKSIRALDGLISGAFLVGLSLYFTRELIAVPILFIKYLYIIPILFIFITIMNIPKQLYQELKWQHALERLRFFSFLTLAFSPFWIWWHNNLNNRYFLFNVGVFIFSVTLTLYNMISIASIASKENDSSLLFLFTKFARLMVIYILIAPTLAFFITIWLGQNGGKEIIFILVKLQGWSVIIFGVPFLLTAYALWHWRLNLVKELTHNI